MNLKKHKAVSLMCDGFIRPDIWRLHRSVQGNASIDSKIYRHSYKGRYIYRVEFIGDLLQIKDSLERLNLNIIKPTLSRRVMRFLRRIKISIRRGFAKLTFKF
jgi:hypothetical protein